MKTSSKATLTAMPPDVVRRIAGDKQQQPQKQASAQLSRPKPSPLGEAAFHGIAGDFVRLVEPHTEADPAALLTQFLAVAGIYFGRKAHYLAEADCHYLNFFVAIVGNTSKGRKGTSYGHVRRLMKQVDEEFCRNCLTSGISSGEGLIWRVRDAIHEQSAIKQGGRVTGYEEVMTDPGIDDKRLLVQEPEFARVLKNCSRESNSASAVIREAWDSGTLNTLTKTQNARATGAHIGIVAHVTAEELTRLLSSTEAANGFANRFLWVYSERSKELPFGGSLNEAELKPIAKLLSQIREWAQSAGRINFSPEAASSWCKVYGPLSSGKPGLLGAVTGRAEAQVVRLATLYAVLDQSDLIQECHLRAALAVWDYADASASFVFGEALGDDTADALLAFLRSAGSLGATRTEISNSFGRNKPAREIERGLNALSNCGLAQSKRDPETGGAPTERWFSRSAGGLA